MANSYASNNFNIDTSTNVAGLTALKGEAPAAGDKIFIYNGATLTVESNLACLQIILGHTSSGAATSGQRYGHVTVNAGVTLTFDGNGTYTNSGIYSNPASAETESKSNSITIAGTSASRVIMTNAGGANATGSRYTVYSAYGRMANAYVTANYSWLTPFSPNLDNTRSNAGSTICYCDESVQGAGHSFITMLGTRLDFTGDFRFNGIDQTANGNISACNATPINTASNTGRIDVSGCYTTGTSSAPYFNPLIVNAKNTYYVSMCIMSQTDIRPTTIIPADFAGADATSGGRINFTWSNGASYSSGDLIYVYNNTGNVLLGTMNATAGSGYIGGLTDNTAYTIYAKASSYNNTFSDATGNITVTPTGKDLTFQQEIDRNTITAPKVEGGHEYQHLGQAATGTSDKTLTEAEAAALAVAYEESRNDAQGTTGAEILTGSAVKIRNVDIVGTAVSGDLDDPTAPVLSGWVVSSTAITLRWIGGTNINFVKVQHKTAATEYAQYGSDNTSGTVTLTGLTADTAYTFKVTAYNQGSLANIDSNEVIISTLETAEIPADNQVTDLLDQIRTSIADLDGFESGNIVVGFVDDIESRSDASFPLCEIVPGQDMGRGAIEQRTLEKDLSFQIFVHYRTATEAREDGTDIKTISRYGSAILRQLYRFNDLSANGAPPCDGFLQTNAEHSKTPYYQQVSENINTDVIEISFRVEAEDTKV
jgi:hypothetical protein